MVGSPAALPLARAMRTVLSWVVLVVVMAGTVVAVSSVTDSVAVVAVGVFFAAIVGTVLAGKVARRDTGSRRPGHV